MKEVTVLNRQEIIAEPLLRNDLFSSWLTFIDATPKTVSTYKKAIKQFWLYLQEQGISHPIREDVIAYREHLKESHKATTVQSYLTAVKLFFQWTAQAGHYPNVAEHIKGAKISTDHKKDYLTSKQTASVLKGIDRSTINGLRDYAILSLMVTTGLRTISVVNANIEDIRTAGDAVALYFKGKGRTEKAEYVKLAEPVEEAIRAYLKARGEVKADAPLFASLANRNNGGRMTTRSIRRLTKDHFIDVGLNSDRLTAHSLRHTCATLNLMNGATLEETQKLLGHKNINTTMVYSHALDRARNNSEYRVANAIFC